MNIKLSASASAILAILAPSQALTAESDSGAFTIRVPLTEMLSTWQDTSSLYDSWINTGGQYNCTSWSPTIGTVNFGQSFLQSNTCKQRQTRVVTIREKDAFSENVRIVKKVNEDGVIDVTNSQSVIGTLRNWISFAPDYTDWSDDGTKTDYTNWTPTPIAQEADFGQSRTYNMGQFRDRQDRDKDTVTGDIRDNGSLVREKRKDARSEGRSIDVTVGIWSDSGAHYGCGSWTPLPDSVDYGTSFTQSRDCSQAQKRTWLYKADGSVIKSRIEPRVITETETKGAIGTKQNWMNHTSTFGDWSNEGARFDYAGWTQTSGMQTSGYGQSRGFKQGQFRMEQPREIDTISGQVRDSGSEIKRTQTISGTESRTVSVTTSAWVDAGGHHSCGSWSPDTGTVNYGTGFTQSRSCSQNQSRNYIHKVGATSVYSRSDSRTISENENRSAVGTKNIVTGYSYSGWGGYSNSGGLYSCGSYSPSTSTVNYGSSFTQSTSCNQAQVRTRTKYNVWTNGATTYNSTQSDSRVVSASQSRSATGSKDYITGTSSGSWSGWSNSGGHYSCGSYSPSPSTVDYGTSFTQTRSCKQNKTRSRTIYYTWAKGGTSVKSSESGSQTVSVGESNSATGTKTVIVAASSLNSPWSTYSTSYGGYSPSASSQTSSFSQSRSRTYNQERYVQSRQYVNGVLKNVGSATRQTQTKSGGSDSRTVSVSSSGYVNYGSVYSCGGGWSPSLNNVSENRQITQTQTCTQGTRNTYSFSIGGSHYKSSSKSVTQSRVKWGTQPEMCGNYFC